MKTTVDQCKIDLEKDGMSCSNHGICTNDSSDDSFTCDCYEGFTGEKCEIGITLFYQKS